MKKGLLVLTSFLFLATVVACGNTGGVSNNSSLKVVSSNSISSNSIDSTSSSLSEISTATSDAVDDSVDMEKTEMVSLDNFTLEVPSGITEVTTATVSVSFAPETDALIMDISYPAEELTKEIAEKYLTTMLNVLDVSFEKTSFGEVEEEFVNGQMAYSITGSLSTPTSEVYTQENYNITMLMFISNGQLYNTMLMAPSNEFEQYKPAYDKIIASITPIK